MKLEMLARHRLLNKQVHVPAVTAAHLNAAAVSNTAIAPSSSLLPPLSSRRSAGARRVATAAAASVALPPPQCRFSRRRSATPPPGIVSHTCRDMCVLCLIVCSSILIARELKNSFPVFPAADCQSRTFGHSKPAGAIYYTRERKSGFRQTKISSFCGWGCRELGCSGRFLTPTDRSRAQKGPNFFRRRWRRITAVQRRLKPLTSNQHSSFPTGKNLFLLSMPQKKSDIPV